MLPVTSDTIYAARSIIKAIVEANIKEREEMCSLDGYLSKRFSSVWKSNDIKINLENKSVYIKFNLQLQNCHNVIDAVCKLQQQIIEEIVHLTGLNVKKVDISIEKLAFEQK